MALGEVLGAGKQVFKQGVSSKGRSVASNTVDAVMAWLRPSVISTRGYSTSAYSEIGRAHV